MKTRYHSYQIMLDNYVDFSPCPHSGLFPRLLGAFFDFFLFFTNRNIFTHIYSEFTTVYIQTEATESRADMTSAWLCRMTQMSQCLSGNNILVRRRERSCTSTDSTTAGSDASIGRKWLEHFGLFGSFGVWSGEKGQAQARALIPCVSHASKCVRTFVNVEGCVEVTSEGFNIFCKVSIKLLTTIFWREYCGFNNWKTFLLRLCCLTMH